jgi:hypothetical protein
VLTHGREAAHADEWSIDESTRILNIITFIWVYSIIKTEGRESRDAILTFTVHVITNGEDLDLPTTHLYLEIF